jgi:hypothetical protein
VRQRLYSDSVLRYRRYARHLAPLLRPLRDLILRYEREAGLDSSERLLSEVLDGGSRAGGVDSSTSSSSTGSRSSAAAAEGGSGAGGADAQGRQQRQGDGGQAGGGRDEL